MLRTLPLLRIAALLITGLLSMQALAEEPTDEDNEEAAETSKAQQPAADPPSAREAKPARPLVAAKPAAEEPRRPKFGDISVSGYFRGSFGGSSEKGRMTCFSLANPSGLVSKYRLGNECEVWAESQFSAVIYADETDGAYATFHFMPTVYIPTTHIGYSPNGTTSSPAEFTTSTGATVSFPNLYVDIKGISWLGGGTAWAGTRYYKRESVYISDFFYWNPSGVGAGVEDINLGRDLRLSYAVFAVDGEPVASGGSAPSLPAQVDLGFRNDLQLRGIRPYKSGEFQVGLQGIANYSNNPATHGGWGVTLQHVQQLLGGDNKLALQYGRGGGTGFGTLARFYYPDFSVRHDASEARLRLVDVLTIQPTDWLGAQAAFVYQHDDLGNGNQSNWYSAGTRLSLGFAKHAKLLGEVGYDFVRKSVAPDDPQFLAKFTIAPAIAGAKGFWGRPELRLFYTYAMWNEAARTATVDSGRLYTDTNKLSGSIFGLQAEAMW